MAKHKASNPGVASRVQAVRILVAVLGKGQSLQAAIEQREHCADARDQALVQALCFGTLRLLPRLQRIAAQLLSKPLKAKDLDLQILLWLSLYQLLETRIPPHAAISTGVAAARALGKPWAAGLLNALLRRFQRDPQTYLARAQDDPEARWLFPRWLLNRLQTAWPQWAEILAASNAQAPLWLRVNGMRTNRSTYAQQLSALGWTSRPSPYAPQALLLDQAVPVEKLPGFREGLVSVQDVHAQLAAPLLDARPGQWVLDACAAPGGKTAHLLERAQNRLHLVALDAEARRLKPLQKTLQRLSLQAQVQLGDVTQPRGDWAERRYDRILLDAPCSATGVIRRHPDIKWLRRDADIPQLVARQSQMLAALWPLLVPGGQLLYATCSLLPEENEGVIQSFLARHEDARLVPIRADWGLARQCGRYCLPQLGGGDGFYYAKLEKKGG